VIPVRFVEPNFACQTVDLHGTVRKELHAADSAADLERRLQDRVDKGLIRSFQRVRAYDFRVWKRWASRESDRMHKAYSTGVPYSFNSRIWTTLREHLLHLFSGKCAFCEASFKSVSWGDAEHYRPKGAVTDENGAPVTSNDHPPKSHPGYWWLAYEVANLLPSCQLCNQPPGKMNKFPIAGRRAFGPQDQLDNEQPLILHPYSDASSPLDHVQFHPLQGEDDVVNAGLAFPKGGSEAGRQTIEACNLNREWLLEARRKEQNEARQRIGLALLEVVALYNRSTAGGPQLPVAVRDEIRFGPIRIRSEYAVGARPFSAAALAEVDSYLSDLRGTVTID
jgi:hypothetical protein